MGGRGQGSASSKHGAIGSAPSIEVINEKHASSGSRWAYTVLEAKDAGNGNLEIGYPMAKRYDHPNKNTTVAVYELKAGFFNEPGNRSVRAHNVDLAKATSVQGDTFVIKDMLKSEGFRWDQSGKKWVRA